MEVKKQQYLVHRFSRRKLQKDIQYICSFQHITVENKNHFPNNIQRNNMIIDTPTQTDGRTVTIRIMKKPNTIDVDIDRYISLMNKQDWILETMGNMAEKTDADTHQLILQLFYEQNTRALQETLTDILHQQKKADYKGKEVASFNFTLPNEWDIEIRCNDIPIL